MSAAEPLAQGTDPDAGLEIGRVDLGHLGHDGRLGALDGKVGDLKFAALKLGQAPAHQVEQALQKDVDPGGLVHRLETLNAFVACAHDHHHTSDETFFAICDSCGHVEEFTAPSASRNLHKWVKDNTFELHTMTCELRGCCTNCSGNHRPNP